MKKSDKIIALVLAVLLVVTTIGAIINMQNAREKIAFLNAAEIAVLEDGQEVTRLTMDEIGELPAKDFTAMLKSSVMQAPKEHVYTGVAFADLFSTAGISLQGKSRVTVKSVDGYAVPLKIEEIEALDNVFLVYKDNGNYLGTYQDANGQGPYMIVIKGDRFSQRWAKYVCELDVQ